MIRRRRKRDQQLELLTKDGTRPKTKRAANKRHDRGGRPPKGARAGSPHTVRPELKPHVPVHVVLRVEPAIGSLRNGKVYAAIRAATLVAARYPDMRIIHVSIQRTHIHLLVEANDRLALAKGMQKFQISAAKHINRAITPRGQRRRRGGVFPDRYHAEYIKTKLGAWRALGYVLNNWRKHREDEAFESTGWLLDRWSTAILFDGWREREGRGPWPLPPDYEPLVVSEPRTWLLRKGWRDHGSISVAYVPSQRIVLATK
jgi:REP element-mobilizing transposase RayT